MIHAMIAMVTNKPLKADSYIQVLVTYIYLVTANISVSPTQVGELNTDLNIGLGQCAVSALPLKTLKTRSF